MKLSDFDYNLPEELIADFPTSPRDHSKLLVLDKKTGRIKHRHFFNLSDYLKSGDVLVLNDSKVFPARLFGQKADTGGKVEILLNKNISNDLSVILGLPPRQAEGETGDPGIHDRESLVWEVMGKNLKVGNIINFENSSLRAEVMKKYDNVYDIKFNLSGNEFFSELEKIGHTPLPPYIKRSDKKSDKTKYQTIYADKIGSTAAPTAGLHFTKKLLEKIEAKGIVIARVTLNVGLGTFAPVKTENIEDHTIHSEYYSVNKNELQKIISAKKEGRRIIAVGTTSTRVLETIFNNSKNYQLKTKNYFGFTKIFIYSGYKFKCIDGLITNFHLPKSTLLMLVAAFAGKSNIDSAYKEAIKQKYRFYSYGDAMLIV